jgi:hypothetical protein
MMSESLDGQAKRAPIFTGCITLPVDRKPPIEGHFQNGVFVAFLRSLTMPTVLLAGMAGTFMAAAPASANADEANLVVEVVTKRNILPAFGWSAVEVFVRNEGTAPATGVTVAVTLPPELRASTTESTSDWECDWAYPVMTCTHVGDFATGESKRAIRRSVSVESAQPGAVLTAGAVVTSTSPESSTSDNTGSSTVRIVESADVRGTIFNDLNADGVRQAAEPTATDVGMSIISQDDEDGYGFSNSYNGIYRETVPVKRYQISTTLIRNNWRFTEPDVGDDSTDSDLRLITDSKYSQVGQSPVFTAPAVVDLGVVAAYRPTRISPASALQDTTPTVKLTGESFTTSLVVALTRPGSAPITGTVSNVATDGTSMDVTFPLAGAALGAWTLTVDRQYGPHAELANAFVVTGPPLRATAAPSITGTVAVSSTVKALPGAWSPAAASYTYQWAANGVAIKGATRSSLTIPATLLGKRLTVRVTASGAGHSPGTATSAASGIVAKGKAPKATAKPRITGTAKAGRKLTAAVGKWSPSVDSYRYEWRVNGKLIKGATARTLTVKSAWRNKKITVAVVARKSGHVDGRATSAAVKIRK